MPSALNAFTRPPPADSVFPFAATVAAIHPAPTLTAPPKAAERAPCTPAKTPPISAKTAVASICHRRTVRIGLLSKQALPVSLPALGKALKLYWVRALRVNVLRRKMRLLASTELLQQLVEVIQP